MRLATGSQIKGNTRAPPVNPVPKEGTKARAVYDLFMASKGKPIAFQQRDFLNGRNIINSLIDYYGLDIRCIRQGKWVLAGEWFGRVYVDYVAEHINTARAA